MPITQTQLEARNKRIGSSDMAIILGLDKRRNAYDLWLDKTGKLKPENLDNNRAVQAGNYFENGVLDYAEDALGKLRRNCFRTAKNVDIPIGANIDAILVETKEPVEAKTAGLFSPLFETWGMDGTDECPDRVLVQSHVHMLCVDANKCYVPAFLGGRGFQMFHVNRDNDIIDGMLEAAHRFWHKHVLADIPPENITPSIVSVKRIIRTPESIVNLPEDVFAEWQETKAAEKEAKKAAEEAQAKVLAHLGTAEAGMVADGMVTYFEQTSSKLDQEKLKRDFKTAYEKCVMPNTYRVARFKKNN